MRLDKTERAEAVATYEKHSGLEMRYRDDVIDGSETLTNAVRTTERFEVDSTHEQCRAGEMAVRQYMDLEEEG